MLKWLFDYQSFMPRSCCGAWEYWELFLYGFGNGTLFLGYSLILPITLVFIWKKWKSLGELTSLLLWFATFIFFCGLYHLLDVIALARAPYRLITLISLLAAIATVGTLVQIFLKRKYLARYPSHLQWSTLLKCSAVGIYGLDAKGCCTFVNPEACRLVGEAEEEQLGEIQQHVQSRQIIDAIRSRVSLKNVIEPMLRKDGTRFLAEYSMEPFPDGSEAVFIFQDVTEREKNREDLVRQYNLLSSQVEILRADPSSTLQHLEQTIHELKEMNRNHGTD